MIVHSPEEFARMVKASVQKAVGPCRIVDVSAPDHSNGWIVITFEVRGARCRIDRDRMELFLDIENPKETLSPKKGLFDSDYSVEAAVDDLTAQLAGRLPVPKNAWYRV